MASHSSWDVVVYGDTSGGVASAIQAARLQLQVVLLSPLGYLGGIQVDGLGATDIDGQPDFQNSPSVGGLALEFHRRISAHYNRSMQLEEVLRESQKDPSVWRFEPKVAEQVIRQWAAEYDNLTVIKAELSGASAVTSSGSTVQAVTLRDGRTVAGKMFIEASYEGDLLAAAGISTVVGRESREMYGEDFAGIREETLFTQLETPIDPYCVPGDAQSGLLFGVSSEPFGHLGAGDEHLAAYCFRIPLTNRQENMYPITRPPDYNHAWYKLHRRYARAGGKLYTPVIRIPGQKTDVIGSESALHTDLVGMNDGWAKGTWKERQRILNFARSFTQGLLYFYTSDESLTEDFRSTWKSFGYCLDEFPDNDHFPRMLYVRDGRRMLSDYVVTQHNASLACDPVHDPVAVAFWPTDTHCARRVVKNGIVHNEGFVFREKNHAWKPFGIPYRALVPRACEATNVITATCPSSSHLGYGAIRIEHQFWELGQACANACALAIDNRCSIQDISYHDLKDRLIEQGAVLDSETVGLHDNKW